MHASYAMLVFGLFIMFVALILYISSLHKLYNSHNARAFARIQLRIMQEIKEIGKSEFITVDHACSRIRRAVDAEITDLKKLNKIEEKKNVTSNK